MAMPTRAAAAAVDAVATAAPPSLCGFGFAARPRVASSSTDHFRLRSRKKSSFPCPLCSSFSPRRAASSRFPPPSSSSSPYSSTRGRSTMSESPSTSNSLPEEVYLSPFGVVRSNHAFPTVADLLKLLEADVIQLENTIDPASPKLDEPVERIVDRLQVVRGIVSDLMASKDSPEHLAAIEQDQPEDVKFQLRVEQNKPILNALNSTRNSPSQSALPDSRKRIVEAQIKELILNGPLDDDKQEEFNKIKKVTSDRTMVANGASICQLSSSAFKKYLKYLECCSLNQPEFQYLFSTYIEEEQLSAKPMEYLVTENNKGKESLPKSVRNDGTSAVSPFDALALAKKAMLATQTAATLAERSHLLGYEFDEPNVSSLGLETLASKKPTIRSGRLLGRKLKKRRVPKKDVILHKVHSCSRRTDSSRKIDKGLNSNDPVRFFLGDPETRQLLTGKEERDLLTKIEDLVRVEEVKNRLYMQLDCEPTLVEWAESVGMSCRELQSCLDSGYYSWEKIVNANFRLVVHVAKQYQGKGLDLQDLLQVGSMGLMKSLKKFKPKPGCRFPTYAYWWIRQSIKKAIFQNSRTIRLPENLFATIKKIKSARRVHIQEKGHYPNNEDLAKRVGITVEKLERILVASRNPTSMQERVWTDQVVTFQEITADPKIETPDLYIAKQTMRQHARNLVRTLPPRERQIIRYRYGFDGGKQKTLSDIGEVYGITKERIRQLESRALGKLKDCLGSQGLEAYVNLLV